MPEPELDNNGIPKPRPDDNVPSMSAYVIASAIHRLADAVERLAMRYL